MPRIVFKHHRDTTNLGDAVIYGGGKIMGGLAGHLGPEGVRIEG
ncbi:MAG: hypothetical protein PHX82_16430 [Paracoccaceae bacterium]|nr:hypothetical protein [Paracoccaceae bacterium]